MENTRDLFRVDEKTEGAAGLIARAAKERFPDIVNSVFVGTDADIDGDKIYRIYVAFEERETTSKDRGLASFLTYLRKSLTEIDDDGFPVVSFISRGDLAKLDLEPA